MLIIKMKNNNHYSLIHDFKNHGKIVTRHAKSLTKFKFRKQNVEKESVSETVLV